MEPAGPVAWAIHRAYAQQTHLIDEGDAVGWAATFTPDGEFDSPSYDAPVTGTAALVRFAAAFATTNSAQGLVSRHVVTNVDVHRQHDDGAVEARAYLQIVSTARGEDSRLVRLTTLADLWVPVADGWRLRRRLVRRDDQAPNAARPAADTTGSDA